MQTNRNGRKYLTIKTFGGSSPSIVTKTTTNKQQRREKLDSLSFSHHTFDNLLLCHCVRTTIAENSNPNQCQTRYKLREIANFLIELVCVCASFFSRRRRRRIFPLFRQRAHPLKKEDCAVHFL